MSNFFNKIDAPQLTSSEYGKSLAEMVDNINANFQKVFTLPFLKGDDGDMVTTEFSYFWDSANRLTQDGASIFNAIFCKEEDPVFSEGLTHKDVQDILCDGGDSYAGVALNIFSRAENGYNPISLFDEIYAPIAKPKILMYYKIASESQTKTPLGAAQLYYYFDARVGKLSDFIKDSSSNTYKENFSDYTCILSTQYNTEGDSITYKFVKQSGWPTLYFDDSSKQFCWQINGVRTGVNAQGVSGKDGRGTKIWLCQVTPAASKEDYKLGMMIKFNIIKIWSNDENGQPSWVEYDKMKSNAGPEENFLRKGDVVIGYLSDSTTKDKKDEDFTFDQILGVIDKEQSRGEFYVCSNLTQNTSNTFFNTRLYNLCARIGSHEDAADAMMKGFIIPDGKTGGHALYEGKFDSVKDGLYLVHTDEIRNIRYGDGSQKIALQNDGKSSLNVYYNTNITGTTTIQSASSGNSIKSIVVNSDGVGINTSPNSSYALNVGGNTKIGGSDKNSHLIKGNVQIGEGTASNNLTIYGDILPGKNTTYNLGSDSTSKVYKWNNVYANTFSGTTFKGTLEGTIVLENKPDTHSTYPIVFASGAGDGSSGKSLYTAGPEFIYNPNQNRLTVPQLQISAELSSSSTNSGALIVKGGAGIAGRVNVGGVVNITNNDPSNSTETGALIVKGGAGIGGAVNISGAVNIGGATTLEGNVDIAKNITIPVSRKYEKVENNTAKQNDTYGLQLDLSSHVPGMDRYVVIANITIASGALTDNGDYKTPDTGYLVIDRDNGSIKYLSLSGK